MSAVPMTTAMAMPAFAPAEGEGGAAPMAPLDEEELLDGEVLVDSGRPWVPLFVVFET